MFYKTLTIYELSLVLGDTYTHPSTPTHLHQLNLSILSPNPSHHLDFSEYAEPMCSQLKDMSIK